MNSSKPRPGALIFGSTGGIGSALARRLERAEWRLALSGRDPGRLEALANELNAVRVAADASDFAAVESVCDKAWEEFGRMDGVVNCCGSLLLKPAHLTSPEEWAKALQSNLTTAFYVLRAAALRMMRTGGGSIVLISSAAARRGFINHEAIAAAKAGVVGLAQAAAATYARSGIRVNCVAPGLTRTPLTESITGSEAGLKASLALHPLGRLGEPQEVASAIAWLLDPEQSWVTGQVLSVDGGLASVQARASV